MFLPAQDAQASPPDLKDALDFIEKNHNRTKEAPEKAVFVAEYGLPQNQAPNATVVSTVENVVNVALDWGCPYVMFWETFDNECTGGPGCKAGRCHDKNTPVTDPKRLHGFWLVKPDGSFSWPYKYLSAQIAKGKKQHKAAAVKTDDQTNTDTVTDTGSSGSGFLFFGIVGIELGSGLVWWLRAPAAMMGSWHLLLALFALLRPPQGKFVRAKGLRGDHAGAFTGGGQGRGYSAWLLLLALCAAWPALVPIAWISGSAGSGWFLALGIFVSVEVLCTWGGWSNGTHSLLLHAAALLAHGPGGLLAFVGSTFHDGEPVHKVLSVKFYAHKYALAAAVWTRDDPRCDLDAHYGEGFMERMKGCSQAVCHIYIKASLPLL